MFSLFEAFIIAFFFIIGEGDLLLRGISLGVPLEKKFYSVKDGSGPDWFSTFQMCIW